MPEQRHKHRSRIKSAPCQCLYIQYKVFSKSLRHGRLVCLSKVKHEISTRWTSVVDGGLILNQHRMLRVPRGQSLRKQQCRAFSVAALRLWNELPLEIRSTKTLIITLNYLEDLLNYLSLTICSLLASFGLIDSHHVRHHSGELTL